MWDAETGRPLAKAIVWLDARTKETADMLRGKMDTEKVRAICGLPISTYFSGVKLRWMLDNCPEVRAGVEARTALFGTIDTWLVWNLTEQKAHVTDVTNAGRTMMMNIQTLDWDETLMDLIGIKRALLPKICSCSEVYGNMANTQLKGVPVAGLIGDQQSALVGQSCFEIGEGKNTYGTGCFLIVNTGTEAKFSKNGLLTTPAYQLGPDQKCIYSLEGSVAIAGAAVQWLRDNMGIIESASDMEALASSVEDTGDVYFVPAFSGLFAPRWREDARGTLVGMTQYTTKAHIARATLASMTYKVNDVLKAVAEDMGHPIKQLRVDGGASVNNLLLQMQADITGSSVVRPKIVETTALGAAFAAGHAVGMFQSTQAFKDHWELDQQFDAEITDRERQKRLMKWESAVERSLGWVEDAHSSPEKSSCSMWGIPTKQVLLAAAISASAASIVTAMTLRWARK